MRKAIALLAALVSVLAASAGAAPRAEGIRARDILPAEGLILSSVAAIRNQAALDAHYYLADEAVLKLGRRTDAVFARYKAEAGEALLLVVGYPSGKDAGGVYGRFGGDFFTGAFDPASDRIIEKIETGDWAGAARRGRFLIVVLEAPDRASCEGLLGRAAGRVPAGPSE